MGSAPEKHATEQGDLAVRETARELGAASVSANTLTIRRSKTDQEGEGAVQYIGGPTVARVRAWLDAAGITTGAMFQRLDKAGRPRRRLEHRVHSGHRPATRCHWLRPRARRGLPPDLPRFRMALSPSAREISPLRDSFSAARAR